MDELRRVLQAIDLLYGSILDEQDLSKALRAAAELTGAGGSAYLTYDTRTGDTVQAHTVQVNPETESDYRAYYSTKDIRMPLALPIPVGQPFTDGHLADDRAYKASEIYDFLLRNDITHILATWVAKGERTASTFSMQRAHKRGQFPAESQQRLSLLMPHLLRAFRVRNLLQEVRQTQRGCRLPFGVVFLDEAGRAIEVSSAAQRLMRDNDGIGYRGGRVHAVYPEDDRRLQRAIGETFTARFRRISPGGTITIKRRSGKRLLNVAVIPMPTPQLYFYSAPGCMLVIFDPECPETPAAGIVGKALQLTDAEAVLACTLFSGITLAEAAQRLGLSVNTCKTQLKSIYAKTGCRSHVELAKKLLMIGIAQSFRHKADGL